jgi:hypothetical protein
LQISVGEKPQILIDRRIVGMKAGMDFVEAAVVEMEIHVLQLERGLKEIVGEVLWRGEWSGRRRG